LIYTSYVADKAQYRAQTAHQDLLVPSSRVRLGLHIGVREYRGGRLPNNLGTRQLDGLFGAIGDRKVTDVDDFFAFHRAAIKRYNKNVAHYK
tara:strand:- start:649 stop:924 length:276 start_codon:yes stop_codon:yes gene_type:complete